MVQLKRGVPYMSKNPFSCDCSVVHEAAVRCVTAKMLSDADFAQVTTFFKVLGDPTRMRIIWALEQHELCVCDIANILDMTKSAVSHQLSTLRKAKLVKFRRDGKTVYYSLADDHVRQMLDAGLEHIYE